MILHRLLPAVLLSLCLAGVAGFALSQRPEQPIPQGPAAGQNRPAVGLPEPWLAHWRGPVQFVLPGGQVVGEFTMAIEIARAADQPAGAFPIYTWAITYERGEDKQTRPYLLRVATSETGQPLPGHFVIDQRNGILVDQFLIGQAMQGHFIIESESGPQVLHARYELTTLNNQPALEVEIAIYDAAKPRRSAVAEGAVESRRLLRVQRGVLRRQ